MTYPAMEALFDDPERTIRRLCVYMALRPPVLSHAIPMPVKVEAVALLARVSTATAGDALAWLIERGYLHVHARDRRRTPTVTLAWALSTVHDCQNRTA